MQLKTGYELVYSFPQPTPIILVVNIHDSRASDLVVADTLVTQPPIPFTNYRDAFGNQCHLDEALGIVGQTIAGIGSFAGVMLVWTGISLALRRLAAWNSCWRKQVPEYEEATLVK